jgi:CBS domain-containing protein
MLRALLWARRRDLLSATRTAGALGRGFGQLLIAGGLVLAIFAGDLGGVWFIFLGWFLLAAAQAELDATTARSALAGLRVAELMVRDPVSVRAGATLQAFMDEIFLPTRHTAFPVLDGIEAVGIVSFRSALEVPPELWPVTSVSAIMATGPDVAIDARAPLTEALPRLTGGDLRRLLVVDDGRLAGLLSATDVLRVLEVRTRVAATERRRTAPAPAPPRPRTVLRPDR